MKKSNQWEIYNSLIDSVLSKSNGKRYGKGFKEVQIRRSESGFQISLTDGYTFKRVKYTSETDLELVKMNAETLLNEVA